MSIKSHRGRRPSLSSPMTWLTRSSSTNSHVPPIRMSQSKSSTSIGSIRHGTLGSGVTIVRTPQEALAGSGVTVECTSDQENDRLAQDEEWEEEEEGEEEEVEEEDEEDEEEEEDMREERGGQSDSHVEQSETPSVPPAYSPPRSSLPLSKSTPSLPLKDVHPARPARPAPPPPLASDTTVLMTHKKLPSPPLSLFPAVPSFPTHLANPSPPQPFECILLSSVPPNAIDFSKVLITLETCTATHRTTLSTLTSRPSHLANYLKSLFSDTDKELNPDTTSLYSRTENGSFSSVFHNHLTSSGFLSPSTFNVHIFLDRASAPYEFVLAYLRSPPTTIDHHTSLPHAVQLHTTTPVRLEALLALRDEAAYLDLPELVQLCNAELRRSPNACPPQHARATSHALAHARGPSGGSVRSMDTLRERDEDDTAADTDLGSTSTSRDSVGSVKSLGSMRGRALSPTTVPAGGTPTKEGGEPLRPTPTVLLHRRLASQSRERAELTEVKSATLRGRPAGNWL
ncbi:hypothetical protein B0F90DRAFT_1685818 [Multifurca ochricompacta]|uniref:BTB/POZ domain-containing protein n=1 Tax=Multifurca ochricompacta TaxID=376703 RepID=A0AAD4MB98_9AGAM|nr:hypothetical protein B0F90DRAFT_1685818 [Multifurca ochricompacta]